MKKLTATIAALLLTVLAAANGIGTWNNYLAYSSITQIVPTGQMVFVVSSKGLFSYNVADESVLTYNKVYPLSDTDVEQIAWCQQAKRLVIVYADHNIDLLNADGTTENISEYMKKEMVADKTVNHIYVNGPYAYLSTGFGVMKLNVRDAEISDTYMLGFSVDYCYIENESIYAASRTKGLYAAPLTANLLDKANWTQVGSFSPRQQNHTLVYDEHNQCYWTKTDDETLTAYKQSESGEKTTIVGSIRPDGPVHNYFGFMRFYDGKLYSCGRGFNNMGDMKRSAVIQLYDGEKWTPFVTEGDKLPTREFVDMEALDIDPTDPTHVIGGARSGVYEYRDGVCVNRFTDDNSTLATAVADNYNYIIMKGVKFDQQGNCWLLNSNNDKGSSINCLSKDGKWTVYHHQELEQNGRVLNHLEALTLDSRGLLWFGNAVYEKPAFYCYDPTSDQLIEYYELSNQDETSLIMSSVYAFAEDRDGSMWIGTTTGPLLLTPEHMAEGSDAPMVQVKVPRNDGTNFADYLLSGVTISAIAVDGAGRKWFGTHGNGIYLISADNIEEVNHFTTDNSPLLSNTIESIAINNQTGEVFIGTDKGLCSYMSDATATTDEMTTDNVYAYPNPVTPDYSGPITITGLTFNADVKILTTSGRLVKAGRSNGGTFVWDGTDGQGRRVASGLYMVHTSTEDGKKGTVCKIAVVN